MASLDLQRSTWFAADTLLGKRDSRKIGHNTRLERRDADRIAVRYHATDILTFTRDGWLITSTGGWDTVTTWARLNALLPDRWASYSRRGKRSLAFDGHAILPYADGLAIHPETGRVGFATRGEVGVLLTAEEVAAIVAAEEAKEVTRAEKRTARLLREHPAVIPGAQTGPHRGYNGRAWDCPRCREEGDAESARRQAILRAEHVAMSDGREADMGSHRRVRTDYLWPKNADGSVDYKSQSQPHETVTFECPWECPARTPRY